MSRSEPTPLLLDTQLLLWWAIEPRRLPAGTASLLADPAQPLVFSVVSLWEVAIKSSQGRADFSVEATALRLGLLGQGFRELPVRAEHALAVQHLPWIHRDPYRCAEDFVFDRLLVVQAQLEGLRLLSADRTLVAYGEHVQAAV
ncbi:type II toxin-antitoxin system VapC family toxin [Cyanobium sp. Candia 9D4]|uniref:type II toxin-antitoxin system VapC family toxin n=1 Tax=Cyanobium sp. Candia 9D4 TaxID=2823707 RepID=UPI0020CC3E1F|nr:type II toxin-antitoxin system VapC family toxin [Cyanobium sp. Candia 9D4]MCP9933483.1 type II toxin-antitoxin system VapC family toxin [Cyanobium sp. Candia 9D4]